MINWKWTEIFCIYWFSFYILVCFEFAIVLITISKFLELLISRSSFYEFVGLTWVTFLIGGFISTTDFLIHQLIFYLQEDESSKEMLETSILSVSAYFLVLTFFTLVFMVHLTKFIVYFVEESIIQTNPDQNQNETTSANEEEANEKSFEVPEAQKLSLPRYMVHFIQNLK